jgi:hypothetical protein
VSHDSWIILIGGVPPAQAGARRCEPGGISPNPFGGIEMRGAEGAQPPERSYSGIRKMAPAGSPGRRPSPVDSPDHLADRMLALDPARPEARQLRQLLGGP